MNDPIIVHIAAEHQLAAVAVAIPGRNGRLDAHFLAWTLDLDLAQGGRHLRPMSPPGSIRWPCGHAGERNCAGTHLPRADSPLPRRTPTCSRGPVPLRPSTS